MLLDITNIITNNITNIITNQQYHQQYYQLYYQLDYQQQFITRISNRKPKIQSNTQSTNLNNKFIKIPNLFKSANQPNQCTLPSKGTAIIINDINAITTETTNQNIKLGLCYFCYDEFLINNLPLIKLFIHKQSIKLYINKRYHKTCLNKVVILNNSKLFKKYLYAYDIVNKLIVAFIPNFNIRKLKIEITNLDVKNQKLICYNILKDLTNHQLSLFINCNNIDYYIGELRLPQLFQDFFSSILIKLGQSIHIDLPDNELWFNIVDNLIQEYSINDEDTYKYLSSLFHEGNFIENNKYSVLAYVNKVLFILKALIFINNLKNKYPNVNINTNKIQDKNIPTNELQTLKYFNYVSNQDNNYKFDLKNTNTLGTTYEVAQELDTINNILLYSTNSALDFQISYDTKSTPNNIANLIDDKLYNKSQLNIIDNNNKNTRKRKHQSINVKNKRKKTNKFDVLCKHHEAGYCSFGPSCKYIHR